LSSAARIAGIAKAQDLCRVVDEDPEAELTAGILGPGGYGKTAVLDAVREAYRSAGVTVIDTNDVMDDRMPPNAAILVDDAHALESAVLQRVTSLAQRQGTRLMVAFRPWPRPRALTGLTSVLRRSRPLVILEQLDREGIERRVSALLGAAPSCELVTMLLTATAGHPTLVDLVLRTIQETDLPLYGAQVQVPPQVLEELWHDIDALPDEERAVLHAVAVGSTLATDVLATVVDMYPGELADVVSQCRANGFLLPHGRLAPVVSAAVLAAAPPEQTYRLRMSLLETGLDRGPDVLAIARALVDDGARDVRVAAVLERAGDTALRDDPDAAETLYNLAAAAGADSGSLAVRRAESAARLGRFDAAMQIADEVLSDSQGPDRARAVDIAAIVLAHRGLLHRAAELYRWLGPDRAGSGADLAVIAMLGIGARDDAERMLDSSRRAARPPTMLAGAQQLMAQGLWESVAGSATAALSTLSRASTLLEPAGSNALVPDTPAALTALVGMCVGELDIAESALRRALAQNMGGRLAARRHYLLLAWIAMLRGQTSSARKLLMQASAAAPIAEPRDELFHQALQVGLARRTSDVPALVGAWGAAREAIVRHPVDLFALLPLGEMSVAAARLGEVERMSAHLDQAWNLLADLGEPVLWATPLHWYGVHAAILAGRPESLEPHAKALVRAARSSHVAGVLAAAGSAWMHVLAGEVDADAVHDAARRLQDLGLAWDASRLLAQAAARSTDRRAITSLLQAARALQETEAAHDARDDDRGESRRTGASGNAARLSHREREVAELLLSNRTYREIGDRLYISPKTVEHHVARIKQRVGASDRSDLLAHLRVALSDRTGSA
jgi:DNA-binding CsgD family transcriptional regulator